MLALKCAILLPLLIGVFFIVPIQLFVEMTQKLAIEEEGEARRYDLGLEADVVPLEPRAARQEHAWSRTLQRRK